MTRLYNAVKCSLNFDWLAAPWKKKKNIITALKSAADARFPRLRPHDLTWFSLEVNKTAR